MSFPLKMQPLVHQWKGDTVAKQPLPGGREVRVGGGVSGRRVERMPTIHQVMAVTITDTCKIYTLVIILNTKIEGNYNCQFDY